MNFSTLRKNLKQSYSKILQEILQVN